MTGLVAGSGARIPGTVHDGDREWAVTRAWPAASEGAGRAATLELRAPDVGDVRAGEWDATRGARLGPWREDPRLTALAAAASEGVVVSHRAGRRAVVRVADGSSFLKVVRRGRASTVLERHESAALFGRSFRVPRLQRNADAESAGVVRFEALPGRTLHALGADPATGAAEWERVWDVWADAWCALRDPGAGHDPAGGLPLHAAADEAAIVRQWAGHAAHEMGSTEALFAAAERIAGELLRGGDGPLVLAHRDLHDKQLLHGGEGPLGLLDLDTVSLAEPALDLGNLRAHAWLRGRQGVWPSAFADIARSRVDAVVERLGVAGDRVAAYEAAARFRLACLYLFRPRWRPLAERLLAESLPPR